MSFETNSQVSDTVSNAGYHSEVEQLGPSAVDQTGSMSLKQPSDSNGVKQ